MRFQHFAKEYAQKYGQRLSIISAEVLISYRSTLDREHEWYLGSLRGFLKSWVELGFIEVNEDVPSLLDSWRLKGNIKGRAVQTLCPIEGPLSDLKWDNDYWPTARITFGNLDQKTRVLDPNKTMQQPFLDFAKAYFRYQQGHKPTQSSPEIRALKCIERALFQLHNNADISNLNALVLDQSALLAKAHFSSGMGYHTGREIARLAIFVSDKQLISGRLDWKSPITRPTDTKCA